MSEAREQIRAILTREDLYGEPPEALAELRLAAAQEAFEFHRARNRVLDRRATDTGVDEIRTLQDIVPLLFAHTTYKSYPQSFVDEGRWDRMTAWFGTLTTVPVDDVDVSEVTDIDGWIDALEAAGHRILTSSGTGGKTSFFANAPADWDLIVDFVRRYTGWPSPVTPERIRRMYRFSPPLGPHKGVAIHTLQAEAFADPAKIHRVSEDRLRIADMQRAGLLRRAIANGTATPAEIAAAETNHGNGQERYAAFIDDLLDHRHEPLFIAGLWGQQWAIVERARERGIPDGEFHPDTLIGVGGGRKGLVLPADFERQVFDFYGDVHRTRTYGMTEVTTPCHACEEGRYHVPPNLILLLLDRPGERLLNQSDGQVEGRVAFFDVSLEGRWGGVISGDKAVVDFGGCTCGRPGPTVVSLSRYTDIAGDDKIECSATIDAYVRGALVA